MHPSSSKLWHELFVGFALGLWVDGLVWVMWSWAVAGSSRSMLIAVTGLVLTRAHIPMNGGRMNGRFAFAPPFRLNFLNPSAWGHLGILLGLVVTAAFIFVLMGKASGAVFETALLIFLTIRAIFAASILRYYVDLRWLDLTCFRFHRILLGRAVFVGGWLVVNALEHRPLTALILVGMVCDFALNNALAFFVRSDMESRSIQFTRVLTLNSALLFSWAVYFISATGGTYVAPSSLMLFAGVFLAGVGVTFMILWTVEETLGLRS